MLAFKPAETSSWEKCSLKVAITPAAFKPSILDQKNHFSFFLFSPSHKAQLFPCYNMMAPPLHMLEDVHLTQYPQISPHTQPMLQLPFQPILEIPSQTSSRNDPIQYCFHQLLKSSNSTASIPPPTPSKVHASQITPLDQSYVENL